MFVSGGGVHNSTVMNGLKERLGNAEFKDFEESGITADSKEAVLMAFLANECVVGGEWELGKVSF
jgi:anhydro-N-acetylmuramic acid kinase